MPTAIFSVSDKTGIQAFAAGLQALGWHLLASGGTAAALRKSGVPVEEVSTYTGSPEVLAGRVKTLHPAIHAGLLARPTAEDLAELELHRWQPIDLVAVNLYPFENVIQSPGATLEAAIENIDIGGVALVRAAAKNFSRVTLVCDPGDYSAVLEELKTGQVSAETRRRLAIKGFALTAAYDQAIQYYLDPQGQINMALYPVQTLRYGENPHQSARLYAWSPGQGPLGGRVIQGKELSFNNLLDLDAAWRASNAFDQPAVVIVKHLSPCGIATATSLKDAFSQALASDPISAYGGVVACNQPVEEHTAQAMMEIFLECIVAPEFTSQATSILAAKKNLRLVELRNATPLTMEMRSVRGGILSQTTDQGDPPGTEWQVVSKRQPSEAEWAALQFAWKACQHVKSNAIVLACESATVGIGGGQPNRVDSARIAVNRAGERARGSVLASDAYFPFPDTIEVAARAGVTAAVHPGGSIRDAESVAAADAAGMALVVTGVRHFRH